MVLDIGGIRASTKKTQTKNKPCVLVWEIEAKRNEWIWNVVKGKNKVFNHSLLFVPKGVSFQSISSPKRTLVNEIKIIGFFLNQILNFI